GRRHPHGGHGALRRPGRGRCADRRPEPGPARRGGHVHHPQVAPRPARRVRALHRRVRTVRGQGLPDGPRRPTAPRQPSFAGYASAIIANAQALAEGLMRRGVRLVTGGTSNHLVLADVAASFGLTGRQAESALLEAGVVTNRNSIPRDANGAWYTSGIRMGTPALTTLGFGPDELDEIADRS